MTEEERFLVYISQFNLTVKKLDAIISQMQEVSIQNFINTDFGKILPKATHADMCDKADERSLRQYFSNLKEKNIQVITRYSQNYPSKLKGLADAPYYLFCKGDLSLFETTCIAIVGTRNPTDYGRIVTDRFAGQLAQAGLTIVSGLAFGVDSIAHRKAIEEGGKTIAVLGCGFNHIYPAAHADLAREIAQDHLLISEFCPSTMAVRYSFPQRNRIIAGLSKGVLITEAGDNSGTKYTRDFALDYGREVYAVPGEITSEKSVLTNDIIKSGQGHPVTEVKDILLDLNIEVKKQTKKVVQLGIIEQKIVDFLSSGEKDINFLSENSHLNVNSLNSYLTMMEINGIIRRMPGGNYCLT